MNLKQARYFITIIEEGSITAAAKKLYVTQPSLSQMLRQIEAECGVDLLVRNPLPMRPTYAGEKYLECARAIILANESWRTSSRISATRTAATSAWGSVCRE